MWSTAAASMSSDTKSMSPMSKIEKTERVLIEAAINGDLDTLDDTLRRGCNVNAVDPFSGSTPLIHAADRGHLPIVVRLTRLPQALRLNAKNHRGATALIAASAGGWTDVVNVLLSMPVQLEATDHMGTTALHAAALEGHVPVVEVLMAAGANAKARDKAGFTPRKLAEREGNDKVVDVFKDQEEKERLARRAAKAKRDIERRAAAHESKGEEIPASPSAIKGRGSPARASPGAARSGRSKTTNSTGKTLERSPRRDAKPSPQSSRKGKAVEDLTRTRLRKAVSKAKARVQHRDDRVEQLIQHRLVFSALNARGLRLHGCVTTPYGFGVLRSIRDSDGCITVDLIKFAATLHCFQDPTDPISTLRAITVCDTVYGPGVVHTVRPDGMARVQLSSHHTTLYVPIAQVQLRDVEYGMGPDEGGECGGGSATESPHEAKYNDAPTVTTELEGNLEDLIASLKRQLIVAQEDVELAEEAVERATKELEAYDARRREDGAR